MKQITLSLSYPIDRSISYHLFSNYNMFLIELLHKPIEVMSINFLPQSSINVNYGYYSYLCDKVLSSTIVTTLYIIMYSLQQFYEAGIIITVSHIRN